MPTKIEYIDESINPIRTKEGGWHCVKTSPGCQNCYAEKINKRFGDGGSYTKRDIELVLNDKALNKPFKWKKPKRIFVQDMSDLFLETVSFNLIYKIFERFTWSNERHTFIILTKRPERALQIMPDIEFHLKRNGCIVPFKNVWFGVTCENQEMFDKRWAILKQIPAAVYMISYEPALGPLILPPDFLALGKRALLICGGESGPKARPMHPGWARKVRDDCVGAGVPFFLKQMIINGKMVKLPKLDGQQWKEIPNAI